MGGTAGLAADSRVMNVAMELPVPENTVARPATDAPSSARVGRPRSAMPRSRGPVATPVVPVLPRSAARAGRERALARRRAACVPVAAATMLAAVALLPAMPLGWAALVGAGLSWLACGAVHASWVVRETTRAGHASGVVGPVAAGIAAACVLAWTPIAVGGALALL